MNPAHYLRGVRLFQHKQYSLAADEFRLQLALVANDSTTHGMLALCLNALKENQAATFHAQQAIQLAPDNAFCHSALAQVLIGGSRKDKAEAAILEAIRLSPECADYLGILAGLQFDKGQFHQALATTGRGLQIDSEHAVCINLRGLALAHLDERQATKATMEIALARRPDHAHTHASQGWALLRLAKTGQALDHFREALRIDPEFEWARTGMAEALKTRN